MSWTARNAAFRHAPAEGPASGGAAAPRAAGRAGAAKIACRSIVPEDVGALEGLLSRGFPERSPAYWRAALARLGRRESPPEFPRYGICLTADGAIVGVVLLIHARLDGPDAPVRCCVSSWYVEPAFRIYAPVLSKVALRRTDCVYVNISPVASTRDGLPAQGYRCYARGQFLAVPAIGRPVPGTAIEPADGRGGGPRTGAERLLADHAAMGCIAFSCVAAGRRWPFVFLKRRVGFVPLPCAQLVYCESLASLVRFQGPIGRHLARRGLGWVMLDANGPIERLAGVYLDDRMPKYVKGAETPRLGDLAYTEAVLFGP